MYDEEEPPMLEQEQAPPDLEFILNAVKEAENEGMAPEQILDSNELAVYLDFIDGDAVKPQEGHYANLVDAIDKSELNKIGQDVVNWVLWDEDTRHDWSKRESEGIRLLGVSDKVSGGATFEGASTVVHPLLAEAVTQFQARSISEMWPPEGPVKSIVMGNKDPDRIAQAQRVEDYMNYQYTEDMPGAFEEEDALLFRLPLSGSCFKKLYYDPLIKKVCSRLVEPADFIVPFSATDLGSAPRYTHRYREMHNTVMKKITAGYYAKTDKLSKPSNESYDYPVVKDEIDSTEGRKRIGIDDDRHTILEMYVDLDIEGFEDIGDDGSPTGVALPYIVWVNRDDQEVLRVQRNWLPDDKLKNAKVNCTHYRFMPGLGFYGYGLLHLIGGLANASTGALRALLDSAAFANMQGGYRTRDSRVKGGEKPLSPGEWREVDVSAEELSKAFYRVPYEEPSQTLFQLLGYLDDVSKKFVGGDVMTGNANPNAPVGTTLALIEQGGKTFSAIHRRLHVAHRNEFRILARLNFEYLPENGYPYFTSEGERNIFPSDFDERVDVIPVSDPSIISNSQRTVQAQAVLDLAQKHPDKVDVTAALRMMLKVMRVPEFEELLKVNEVMQAQQQKMAELEMQLKQAEIDKVNAEKDKLDAEKTESTIRSLFSSIQAANIVATNPAITPIADSIFASAGGIDLNGGELIQQSAPMQPMALPVNTSPGFPANSNVPAPVPETPEVAMPIAPDHGAQRGIETSDLTD